MSAARQTDSTPPAGTLPRGARVRVGEDGFVPDVLLDAWLRQAEATRAGALLTSSDGRRFALRDALRVLGRRNGDTDPYGLTGRVQPIRDIVRSGGTVTPDGIRLGPAIYDVEFGVLAQPLATADESGPVRRVD